jgi:hypothetical protein
MRLRLGVLASLLVLLLISGCGSSRPAVHRVRLHPAHLHPKQVASSQLGGLPPWPYENCASDPRGSICVWHDRVLAPPKHGRDTRFCTGLPPAVVAQVLRLFTANAIFQMQRLVPRRCWLPPVRRLGGGRGPANPSG